jgi:exodeoxyribonuclease VII small subunit
MPETSDAAEPDYTAALAELETIVAELDGASVDVDHLSSRVQRAAELIAQHRSRISTARAEVANVVVDHHPTDDA